MTQPPVRIYHNARCSKSRSACSILEAQGLQAEVIDYLKTPPSREELWHLIGLLGVKPLDLVRQGEPLFKERYAGRALSDEAWVEALAAHPELLERPIVVRGDRAIVARPPEKLLNWLETSQSEPGPR